MLASLARQARESSRQPRASSNDDTIYWPGYHDLDGVTFNLHCPLISYADSSILGSASTLSILALVSNGINLGSVFINENQHLLKVMNQFTKDGDVIFYNVTIQQPFEVFTNLQIRSNGKSNKSVPEKMVRAHDVDVQWPEIKSKNVKLLWEGSFPKLVKCAEGLDIGVAANLDVVTSAEWQVRGLSDVKLDVNVELAGKVQTSFVHVPGSPVDITSPQISQCERSSQITRTVAGFGLTGRTEICLIAEVKYVGQITREMRRFDYFRDWGVVLRRSGTFTGKSTKFAKPKLEVLKNLRDRTGLGGFIISFTGANIRLSPNIRIFGKMTMEIGGDSWETRVGLNLELQLTFTGKVDDCPLPYLSREGKFSVWASWWRGGLNLFGAKVVSPKGDAGSFKSSSDLPRGCLFGRRISDRKSKLREIDATSLTGKTHVVEFKRNEDDAILCFSGLPKNVSAGNCYALVTLGDLTPLAEAIQLDDVTWAIRLEEGDINWLGTLRLPVYRKSKEAMKSRDIALLHAFWAPGGLFCNESDERIAIGKDLKVGCIEPSLPWEAISAEWVALNSEIVAWSAVGSRTPVNGFYLQLFDLAKAPKRPKGVHILRSKYYLGPDTVSIVLLHKFALPFILRNLPLVVRAPSATGVDFYCDNSRERVSPLSQGSEVFQHYIGFHGTYIRFVATTNDPTIPFRVFTISVGALTLFEYSNPDGVVHFHGIGIGTKFEPGFSLQLARPGTVGEVYKTWQGAKPTETVFGTPGEITIHLIHRDPGSWELGATFHDPQSKKSKEIPWGLHKYIENPVAFFESLGIPKGETNKYTVDQVEMTTQGLIRLKAGIAIDRVKLKKANILELLDLTPKEANVKYPFQEGPPGGFRDMEDDALEQETSHGLEADMALTIEIVAGAFGGALIVGLIGLVVYRRRSKSKAKSSSEILDECSSDEVIREGLTERVE